MEVVERAVLSVKPFEKYNLESVHVFLKFMSRLKAYSAVKRKVLDGKIQKYTKKDIEIE